MSEPQQLFTVNEIAGIIGTSGRWMHHRLKTNPSAPRAEYTITSNRSGPILLWSQQGVMRWQAFHASCESTPPVRFFSYSDHNAVNRVGGIDVTWKLWWRTVFDGGTQWWFSTPQGWWTSVDDGRSWQFTDMTVRPGDYRYQSVNANVMVRGAMAAVLRSAHALRQRLESEVAV